MPRRKKLPKMPNYEGMARNPDSMLIQKANPLQSLSETKMTLAEFKILDAYLSRIDSHKPDERYVRFEKGELEKLLGVTRILKDDLSKRIDNLFQVITIRDENKPRKFTKIALFAKAECEQDENGQWQVDLACSAEAMEYVFNIENIGYLKYRLKNVIDLTSRYSYVLYLYLENNRFRKSWNIPLNDLKALLRCTAERYEQYKFFNSEILKKCHKELNEKTNIKYSYEPIKSGRKVTEIRFTLTTQADEDLLQLTFSDLSPVDDEEPDVVNDMVVKYGSEQLAELASGADYEFGKSEMEEVLLILTRIDVPPDRYGGTHWGRVRYLREKYAALNVEATKKEKNGERIKNRYAYFKKMLEQDTYTPAAIK